MMTEHDFRLLAEASKTLHGYLLHTWFMHHLSLIEANTRRWIEHGVLGEDGRPDPHTGYRLFFDFSAIDLEKLTYLIGLYSYILASHKKANSVLVSGSPAKRVLYLRGFDFEGSVGASSSVAMGYSSSDTLRFTHTLGEQLYGEFEVFTALSPRDLFLETIGAQKYFHGDYDRLVQIASEPIRSVYLNARHWQDDVADLVDRVDAFVVYVSAMTESVFWELELLIRKQRNAQATVVFDEEAIGNKEIQIGMDERMEQMFPGKLLWSNRRSKKVAANAKELRERLSRNFLVVSPDEFFASIDSHKARMADAHGPADAPRNAPLPFRFAPAVDAAALRAIEEVHRSLGEEIDGRIASRAITNLPWFLNQVQLRIFTSLMLGRHDQTGRAMAVHAAAMDVSLERMPELRPEERNVLQQHSDAGHYLSQTLMAYGQSHEFGSYLAKAVEVHEGIVASTSAAVHAFYDEGFRRLAVPR